MVMYIGGQKVSPIIKVGEINNQDKTITENGTYTADAGYTGLGEVTVNVPSEQPVITELNVTPTTSAQTIVAPTGTDGYSPVNVAAVTSNIDDNIIAGNIKKNVNILGVIGTLEEGVTPTGTINITQNGTVDVTNYANANVNVSGLGIPREVSASGVYQLPSSNFVFKLPIGTTDVGNDGLYYAFSSCDSVTSADLSTLTAVSGRSALNSTFFFCRYLTSVNLSNLVTVTGSQSFFYTFYYCNRLTSVDLSSLTSVAGGGGAQNSAFKGAFYYCSALTDINLSSLTTMSSSYGFQEAFYGCTSLASIDLSSLTTISGSQGFQKAFYGCTSLTSLSFPALTSTGFGGYTNQFNGMLQGVTGCTVHFPSNLQTVIGSWSDVTAGFGGTNTTVLFDLPATT